jgi:hypothetical protein
MKYIVATPKPPAYFWVTKRPANTKDVLTTNKFMQIWPITTPQMSV